MKKSSAILIIFFTATIARSLAQDKDFGQFAQQHDSMMVAAYKAKDITAYHKYLDDFLSRYNNLDARDREDYKEFRDGDYYNLSCAYSLLGDKSNALDYLEKSEYYDYEHLQQDHDMDNIRNEQRFIKFLDEAKRQEELARGTAFKTPYKPNLSDEEKIAGLSQLWSQAKYNFVYFDHTNIDWNKSYLDYLPKILATKSTAEYYKVLETFYAQLKDGHTNVYPPKELRKEFYSRPPMLTELVEGRVFVTDVFSDTLEKQGILPGVEILEIDHEPVIAYAEKNVKPYESSSTPQDMEIREFSYALLCGPDKNPLALELKDATGKVFTRTIPRGGYHDIKSNKKRTSLDYEEIGNIGYLAINNFEDENIDKQFDSLFAIIAKTKGLIIDIRNNGGGSGDIGFYIISKLTDKPFKISACKRLKYISAPGGKARWEILSQDIEQPDGKLYYSKPVVLLTGPRTFSAAEDFAVAFDYMKRGKLIGEPTGGSTGQPVSFDLPGGGMARVCGKRDTYPDGKEFVGIGIIPDIVITPTVKDIRSGKDAAKDKAVEILNGQ